MKKFYFATLLILSTSAYAQTTISCDSVLQTSTCAGGNVIIPFSTTGTFPWGCVFTAELSDNWGNWGSPASMGTTQFLIGGNGIIFGTIPASANFGFLYRIRIVSSNPVDTSSESPNTIIITQIAQLNQIVSNPNDSACPGDTITLTAINLASSYLWSTGDTSMSIQVTQSGNYSVTTTDMLTCESTAYDTIVFDPAFCTGISEQELNAALDIYPNPAHQNLFIKYDLMFGPDDYFEITDVSGKIIRSEKLNRGSEQTQQIDVSGISSGMYFFILHTEEQTIGKKLVID